MELIVGALIALVLVLIASRAEKLGEDNERAWVNRLADESRRRALRGKRPRLTARELRRGTYACWKPAK